MAFTDNCDLFAAVHEDGVNRVIQHIMRQRPSWFNYGSADVAGNRELWCHQIDVTKDVIKFANPFFTVMPPFPVIGSDNPLVLTGFCAQLTKALIDFEPGKTINLPPELNPPLKPQRFSLRFTVCGGLVCPSEKELEQIPVGSAPLSNSLAAVGHEQKYPPIVVRGRPICFCLDVFVVGRFELTPNGLLLGKVEGLEIVDIKPERLEANLECYLRMSVNVVLREKLAIALDALALSFPLLNMGTITLFPTPNPPVPNNPAIEDDRLKVFITMTT
jgi:hypothetical protein